MSWSEVLDTLKPLISRLADPERGQRWLDELLRVEDGELLGACLAIDLKGGATPESAAVQVLDELGDGHDARQRFQRAVSKCAATVRCCTQHTPAGRAIDGGTYVRVMELGEFIRYYLGPIYGYSPNDPADVEAVRRLFLTGERKRPLGDITRTWSGANGIVWVSSGTDLERYFTSLPSDSAATAICEVLGLPLRDGVGPLHRPELILVTYASNFERRFRSCHQPTAFDADWEEIGTLFVSYPNVDGWGRTRSCSGARPIAIRERVHREFEGLTDDFIAQPLGIAEAPTIERNSLVSHAYARLALTSHER